MTSGGFSRRAVAIGGGIAAALGITALGVTVPRLFGTHYRRSPYDDLFAQLVDRDAAVKVGQASGGRRAAESLARDLRQRLTQRTLGDVTNSDLAQNKLTEVQGWVMPETLVMLCVLAAEES